MSNNISSMILIINPRKDFLCLPGFILFCLMFMWNISKKKKLLFKEFFQKNDKLGILGYPKLNVKRKSPAKDSLLSLELEKIANGLLMWLKQKEPSERFIFLFHLLGAWFHYCEIYFYNRVKRYFLKYSRKKFSRICLFTEVMVNIIISFFERVVKKSQE